MSWVDSILALQEEAKNGKSTYFDLNDIAFERLKSCKSYNGIIAFPDVFLKLCRSFSIKKQDCWKLLRHLRDIKKIDIIPTRGVRILEET